MLPQNPFIVLQTRVLNGHNLTPKRSYNKKSINKDMNRFASALICTTALLTYSHHITKDRSFELGHNDFFCIRRGIVFITIMSLREALLFPPFQSYPSIQGESTPSNYLLRKVILINIY